MWKKPVFAFILGTALLVGCNNNGEDAADEVGEDINEGVNEVQEGVNEGVDEVQEGANDVLENDSYDNGNDVNNGTNDAVGEDSYNDANRGPEGEDFNAENGTDNTEDQDGVQNSNGAGQNGVSGEVNNNDERILEGNQEDIIEDEKDLNDRDNQDE
ncbi:hypothetical protein SFC08_06035 [Lysinibacillus halotolerans]|uniref:Uncharacterized protein n=1 Tax=Lysinibacillus halotolerans TaxID=1368476 RepID=A0A3M8HC38_9BACI|nr:hypothetical protein [Lysinibacillus halotolerans]RNC99941.1 hypothetical protein EC501_06495 [Lysinibacillus halotolerans]